MRTAPPLVAPLFRSEGQSRVLAAVLFSDRPLSLTEIAEQAGAAYPSVHREIARLEKAGMLRVRSVGRTRLVEADPSSPLVPPVRQILLISNGPAVLLAAELRDVRGIETAFIFGSFAERMLGIEGAAPGDVDVMVIGEPDPGAVYDVCRSVEEQVGRPVNAVILTLAELLGDSGFTRQVRSSSVVPVIGVVPWE